MKLGGLLNGVNTLVVLPDDRLHNLPFQALIYDGKFVTERFAVVNYPSASIMNILYTQRPPTKRESMLAVAYSDGKLRFVEEEVKNIKRLLGQNVFPLTGISATKENFSKLVGQFDVVHLAVHGIPSPNDPLSFALQLAPAAKDDGRLFVYEIFSFQLNKALVVLSACETGVETSYQLGISPGSGVIGLNRAFLFAGASSVVSTLWKVDDEVSTKFMRMFYHEIQKTENTAVALQRAQQTMIATEEFSHPYYWAPYVVTGF